MSRPRKRGTKGGRGQEGVVVDEEQAALAERLFGEFLAEEDGAEAAAVRVGGADLEFVGEVAAGTCAVRTRACGKTRR